MQVRSCGEEGNVEYDFLGVTPYASEHIFGLEAYLEKYGHCDADGPDLRQRRDEFDGFSRCAFHCSEDSQSLVLP